MDLSKLGGCSGSGALKLNGLQNGWLMSANAAQAGQSTITNSITTNLSQMLSVDVPAGKEMVLCGLQASSGLSTSQLLTAELEIDGVVVLSGTVTPSSSSITFIGNLNVLTTVDIDRLLVSSNFKLRLRTATTTQSNIPFVFRYFLI